jgi:hypothetical protein
VAQSAASEKTPRVAAASRHRSARLAALLRL